MIRLKLFLCHTLSFDFLLLIIFLLQSGYLEINQALSDDNKQQSLISYNIHNDKLELDHIIIVCLC